MTQYGSNKMTDNNEATNSLIYFKLLPLKGACVYFVLPNWKLARSAFLMKKHSQKGSL